MNSKPIRTWDHPQHCTCGPCVDKLRSSQTRMTHDAPMAGLSPQSVSALEVLQDWQLRELRKTLDYEIGEDWSDD